MQHDQRVLGHKIMVVRKSVRVTNAALTEKIGLSRGQVWRIEAGIDRVSSSMLLQIAKALGVNVICFFQANPLEPVS